MQSGRPPTPVMRVSDTEYRLAAKLKVGWAKIMVTVVAVRNDTDMVGLRLPVDKTKISQENKLLRAQSL